MSDSPVRITVAVPAYNAYRTMRDALTSVLAQLPASSEVVVVDDGSVDGTAAIAESFGAPVRVIRAAHLGIAGTVNRAVAEARGSLLAFIDADDVWLPGKLDAQIAALDADPRIDGVLGHLRQRVSPDLPPEVAARFAAMTGVVPGLHRGVLLIRRQAWDHVGGMESDLPVGEFVSWYLRAIDAGLRLQMLPDLVYERRIHGANTMLGQRDLAADYLRVVKATLDRRRRLRGEA